MTSCVRNESLAVTRRKKAPCREQNTMYRIEHNQDA